MGREIDSTPEKIVRIEKKHIQIRRAWQSECCLKAVKLQIFSTRTWLMLANLAGLLPEHEDIYKVK